MARITTKLLGNITVDELNLLKELTLWDDSGMNKDVIPVKDNLHEFHTFLAHNEKKELIGWAVVFPFRRTKCYWPSESDNRYAIYMYVNPERRSRGVGQQLFRNVRKFIHHHRIKGLVFPWDAISDIFYDKCLSKWRTDRIKIYNKND